MKKFRLLSDARIYYPLCALIIIIFMKNEIMFYMCIFLGNLANLLRAFLIDMNDE